MGITNELTKRAGQVAKAGAGIFDKATGRAKSAAGDLLGRPDLRRQGIQEQAKGEARQEAVEQEIRVEGERARAEAVERDARDRAAEAAQREFARAERQVEAQEARVEAEEREAERREAQVEVLEQATDADALADAHTRAELEQQADELGIQLRSQMTKKDLAREIVARR